jgi:hypothetical protein
MNGEICPELEYLESLLVQLYQDLDNGADAAEMEKRFKSFPPVFDADGNNWSVDSRSRPPQTAFIINIGDQPPQSANPYQFKRNYDVASADDYNNYPPTPTTPPTNYPPTPTTPPTNYPPTPPTNYPPTPPTNYPPTPPTNYPPNNYPPNNYPPESKKNKVLDLNFFRQIPTNFSTLVQSLYQRLGNKRRLIVIGTISALLILAVVTLTKPPSKTSSSLPPVNRTVAKGCPPIDPPVSGILPGTQNKLARCLAKIGDPSLLALMVATSSDGAKSFNATVTPSRQALFYTAGVLYDKFGDGPPPSTVTADLSLVAPSLRPAIQEALNAGIISAGDIVRLPEPISREDTAVVLYNTIKALATTPLPPSSALAPDANQASSYAGLAQAQLAALGISDVAPGSSYNFTTPLSAGAYVDTVGKTLEFLKDTPSTPTPYTDQPTSYDIKKVIKNLISGDRIKAASVIINFGSENQSTLQTATFAGITPTKLKLVSSAVLQSAGLVQSTINLVPISGNDTNIIFASATVTWEKTTTGWKIANWPVLVSK